MYFYDEICFIPFKSHFIPQGLIVVICTLSCRSTGSSRFWRNPILIHLGWSPWMDIIPMNRLFPMTGILLPGHEEFASPDPHRASQTGDGERSVSTGGPDSIANELLVASIVTTATVAALQFHL